MDYEQENLCICEKCGERIKKDVYKLDDLYVCEDCYEKAITKADIEYDASKGN